MNIKNILLIFCIYTITSITEYIYHKYVMHSNKVNNISIPYMNHDMSYHLKHHLDVEYNMKLNKNYKNHLDGLYFIPYDIPILIMSAFILYYILHFHNK